MGVRKIYYCLQFHLFNTWGMWWPAWTALLVVVVGGGGAAEGPEGGGGERIDSSISRHSAEHEEPTRYYNDVTNLTSSTYRPSNRTSSSSGPSSGTNGSYSPNKSYSAPQRTSPASNMSCEEARIKCALRGGCGMALQNYMLGCSDLMSGRIEYCDEYCKNSLIALTSTEVGHALMDCICSDDYCRETKARVEVCREEVIVANADSSVVSCSVAHWICSADTLCSTAISYYDRYCRRMFLGKGCSFRCNNSISILQRQEKAAKLETCICDGTEDFDCTGIKRNMARLCFHQFDEEQLEKEEEETNEVDTTAVSRATRCNSATGGPKGQNALILTVVVYALVSAVVRWR